MASEMLGRTTCPECGFHAAHVKVKTDKEGARPYRHCPDCGAQYHTKNEQQADNLRATVRPEKSAAVDPVDTATKPLPIGDPPAPDNGPLPPPLIADPPPAPPVPRGRLFTRLGG